MSWLEDKADTALETTTDNKWLKLEIPKEAKVGATAEAKIRILDEEPEGSWRHWYGNRSYNCPGMSTCPACKVRMAAKVNDPDGYRDEHRMDYRNYFNVLADGEVKIFSFGNGVAKQLKTLVQKKGDLRDYDLTIIKRKTGFKDINVEYSVFFEGERVLTDEEKATAENGRYSLTEYTSPADHAVIAGALLGEAPGQQQAGITNQESDGKATRADLMVFKALVEAKGFQLAHFGIDPEKPQRKDVIDSLIKDLRSEE